MAGLYIHIPFCKKACAYCDFHFSTSIKYLPDLVAAICKEIELKQSRLAGQTLQSIYFGGGTPSFLPSNQLAKIFSQIEKSFDLTNLVEVTLEANPDDLTRTKLNELRQLPVNRFSIGVQSFHDEDLLWMNRAHKSEEAFAAVKRSQDTGFENLTIDLIYGYPLLSNDKWHYNINSAIALQVPHISAYSLTVEERTALAHQIKVGKLQNLSDDQSANHFAQLVQSLAEAGFEHYEISNFAKPNQYALHNTNYWRGEQYLGIGPSAHGFDGSARYANIANNIKYLKAINAGELPESIEVLTPANRFNEYVMTALRTMWGIDIAKIERDFDPSYITGFNKELDINIAQGNVLLKDNHIILSSKGKLFADRVAAGFFVDETTFC